jgi:signal peptidase I
MKLKSYRWIGKTVKIICAMALILLLVFQVFVLGVSRFGGESAVENLPYCILEISSDSMYPKLKTGDGVFSVQTPFEKIKVGDMITFYNLGELVTHQVVAVNEDGTVTTQGLMNSYTDGNVSKEYYMGRVLFRLPCLDKILDIIQGPVRKTLVILLIVVLCFGTRIGSVLYDKVVKLKEKMR